MAIVAPLKYKRPKIISIPEDGVKCLPLGIVVKDTDYNVINKTLTIIIPSTDRQDADKILEIGEVVSKGSKVDDDLKVGDIILYRRIAAFYIPNGIEAPYMWAMDSFAVVAKIGSTNE